MAVAALATTALAIDYTVDDSLGWDTYVDYEKWIADKVFMVGDTIRQRGITPAACINMAAFKYEPYHNVLEVTEADYGSCATGSPISTHSGGKTTFELGETGTRYFICGIPRHCTNGTMHLKISTVPKELVVLGRQVTPLFILEVWGLVQFPPKKLIIAWVRGMVKGDSSTAVEGRARQ
ncbi:Blue copper protein [Triticum urartu]|uniref:Phytocyanin domain-containing protein n=2 Tax=Triticum TaxID=4564 RepID=A0A9R1NQS4_TRITD|nr:Blue copper protein [Triticum urartu]VAH29307.1 unnamed protein product [Triticum turgidum subsp. durum]